MCAASPEESLREFVKVVHWPFDTAAAANAEAVEEAETRRRC
jgi:hypothetical protein